MMPVHILVQNLLNDFAQLGMPWDNVEESVLQRPKKINTKSIRTYMFWFGFASTVADILDFAAMQHRKHPGRQALPQLSRLRYP